MRTWIAALLLVVLAFAGHHMTGLAEVSAAPGSNPVQILSTGDWTYPPNGPFHAFLPAHVKEFHSAQPREVANQVCAAFGGEVEALQPLTPQRQFLNFRCIFHEPDVTISADFGDLGRIPTASE